MNANTKNSIIRSHDFLSEFRKFSSKRSLTYKVLANMSGQMAEMLDAGVDVKLVFYTLGESAHGCQVFRDRSWEKMLEEGCEVSEIFREYRFPAMFVNTVATGEQSGQMVESLLLLGEYYEKIADLKEKAIQAAIYPLVILLTVMVSIYFMLKVVLPNFRNLYLGMGLEIPEYTQMLFYVQVWLDTYSIHIAICAGIIICGGFLCAKLSQIRNFLLWIGLRFPIFGRYIRYRNTYVLVTQLSLLMRGGVSVQEALANTQQLFSGVIGRRFESMRRNVLAGAVLSESLQATRCFDEQLLHFIAIGESTGKLAASFTSAQVYYNQKIKRILLVIVKGIEPFALLITGIFILCITLAMLLPIFNLIEVV